MIGSRPRRHNYFLDSDYLPTLDGWRVIAIFYVTLDHTNLIRYASQRDSNYVLTGYLGVWIFFAISGLLICSRLLRQESRVGFISLRTFFAHRIFRIQPAALVYLGVLLLLFAAGRITLDRRMMFGALFQYADYVDYYERVKESNWFARHFWSLSVEEHFYLILPFLLVLIRRFRLVIFILLTSALLAWELYASQGQLSRGYEYYHRTDLMLTGLLIPATFAIALRYRGFAERFPAWPTALAPIVIIAVVHHTHDPLGSPRMIDLYYPIVFSVMIICTVQNPLTWFGRLLESKPMRFAGRLSYSFYLYQQIFFLQRVYHSPGWLRHFQQFPLDYICAGTLAYLSYTFIEKPIIAWGHRRFTSPKPATPAIDEMASAH